MTVCVLYLLLTMPLVRLQSAIVVNPDNIHKDLTLVLMFIEFIKRDGEKR